MTPSEILSPLWKQNVLTCTEHHSWNGLTMRSGCSSCSGDRGLSPGLGCLSGAGGRGASSGRARWRTLAWCTCDGSQATFWLCPILHWLEQSNQTKKINIISLHNYNTSNLKISINHHINHVKLLRHFNADLMGFIGHGLGRAGGSGPAWISSMSCWVTFSLGTVSSVWYRVSLFSLLIRSNMDKSAI